MNCMNFAIPKLWSAAVETVKQPPTASIARYGLLLWAMLMSASLVVAAPPPGINHSSLDQQLLSLAANASASDVQGLIQRGAHVNEQDRFGVTPLMQAVIDNNIAAMRALLSAGADPNLRDLRGDTALDLARQLGRVDIERLLIGATR